MILDTYKDNSLTDVLVDTSVNLDRLVQEARTARGIPFDDRIALLQELTIEALPNAFEIINYAKKRIKSANFRLPNPWGELSEDDKGRLKKQIGEDSVRVTVVNKIIYEYQPMSFALEHKAGCCRYQAALFFVLGYEADLGDKHFIQYAQFDPKVISVFNDVVHEGRLYRVSNFRESLKDKSLDYAERNPDLYKHVLQELKGDFFVSYHRGKDGKLVIIKNPDRQVTGI